MQTTRSVLELISQQKSSLEAIPTGFKKIDRELDGGIFRKELVVIGAFTGTGKSYLAGQLFYQAAVHGFNSAYFSLEISNEMVVSRLIGSLCNIKPTRIRMGTLSKEEYELKVEASAKILALDNRLGYCDDQYQLGEIIKSIEQTKPDYVVLDFLQNVFDGNGDEYSRLSAISLKLQQAAKKNNCAIVCLSQISNTAAKDGSKGKTLEYKGSGNIATVSDLGFILERDVDGMKNGNDNQIMLTLKKNRRGASGITFPLFFKYPGGWIYEQGN